MTESILNRIMQGAKTPEGKVVAVLLVLSLALMAWNVSAIQEAFAEGQKTVRDTVYVQSDDSSSKKSKGSVTVQADSGSDASAKADSAKSAASAEPAKSEAAPAAQEEPAAKPAAETTETAVSAASEQPAAETTAAPAADDNAATTAAATAAATAETAQPEAAQPATQTETAQPATSEPAATSATEAAPAADDSEAADEQASDATENASAETAGAASEPEASSAAASVADDESASASAAAAEADADKSDKSADKDEEEKFPAAEFTASANGVTVSVSAPEGAFPEGTKMQVKPVATASVLAAVNGAVEGEVAESDVLAVDITFTRKGQEIEPKVAINVSLSAAALAAAESAEGQESLVVHVDDANNAEVVASSASASQISFASDAFSTYVVLKKSGDAAEGETEGEAEGDTEGAVEGESGTEGEAEGEPEADTYSVHFVIENADGTAEELLQRFDRSANSEVGELPEGPFHEGYHFLGWFVRNADGSKTEVTPTTVVKSDITAYAEFKSIDLYNVEVEYWYQSPSKNTKVVFSNNIVGIDAENDLPLEIESPSDVVLESDDDSSQPTYYASQPSITVTKDDLASAVDGDGIKVIKKDVEYIRFTAEYDFVYLLQKADGSGYDEIERVHANGVQGSTVNPPINTYENAVFESAEPAVITEASGQEIPVYYMRANFTLSYSTDGGSYVAPTTAPYGAQVAVTSTAPTKTGYDFAGWYLDSELTQKAGSTVELNANTTLYAKWEGKTVNYTIVYMKEKYDNATGTTTWVYDNSRNASAQVGTKVSASDAPTLTNNVNGYEKDTERNAASIATVKADGSTVLKAYYKLTRYTLVFNVNNSNGRITIGGQTYTGSNYKIEDVVLGQDVSSSWPAMSSEIYDINNSKYFGGWTGASATYITKRYELIWDNVSKANSNHEMTFKASWDSSSYSRNAEYWLQQPDGSYVADDTYTQIGLNTNNLGAKDIDGYTKHSGTPSGYSSSGNDTVTSEVWVDAYTDTITIENNSKNPSKTITQNGRTYTLVKTDSNGRWAWYDYTHTYTCNVEGHYETQTNNVYTYRFYYDRSSFKIDYYDGSTNLGSITNILFGADISSSTYNYTPAKPADKEDYTWGGWCTEAALTSTYTFNTMPGNNLVLYANWIAPQHTVSYDTQGGAESYESETVDKGKTVESPGTPTREHYTFTGWWTAPEGGELYDWDKPVTSDITLYAQWQQDAISYTVHYVENGTGVKLRADKTETSPLLTAGTELYQKAANIIGYRPDAQTKSLELTHDTNEITFYYSKYTEKTTYTIEYRLGTNTDIQVREPETVEVAGTQSVVVASAKAVDKDFMATQEGVTDAMLASDYYPIRDVDELVIAADASKNVLTFYYTGFKTSEITVRYVDMDGVEIPGTREVTNYVKIGTAFEVPVQTLTGYTYNDIQSTNGNTHDVFNVHSSDNGTVVNVRYKRNLTIAASPKSKSYDGEPLVSEGVGDLNGAATVGLREGDVISSVAYDGSQTVAGSSSTQPKNAVITRNGGSADVSSYYVISYIPATLTVTNTAVTVIVEPDRWNDGDPYDGTERTIGFRKLRADENATDGVFINNAKFEELYGKAIRDSVRNITLTKVDAGTYKIPASDIEGKMYKPSDPNFTVTYQVRDGELTIPQANATVKTGSATRAYDGTELTNKDETTIEGIVARDQASVSVTTTGTQTAVGTSQNTVDIEWGTVNSGNYNLTYDLGTLEVTRAAAIVTTQPMSKTFGTADPETFATVVSGVASGESLAAAFHVSRAPGENIGTYVITPAPLGASPIQATDESGAVISNAYLQGNYIVTYIPALFTISAATATLTAASDSKTYDGTALTAQGVTATGLPEGYTVEATTVGSQTNAGESANSVGDFTIKDASGVDQTANFANVTKVDGKLTVKKAPVTITTGSAEKAYDGTVLTKDEAGISGLVNDETATVMATGTRTEVGSVDNTYDIDWGETSKDNYELTENLGTLTVTTSAAEVTLTAASDSKTYDGAALTNAAVTATGLPEGFTVEAAASGSQTDAGKSKNVVNNDYVIKNAAGEIKTANFTNVTKVDGELTVDKAKVTITTGSDSKAYDGAALTKDEASIEGLVNNESATVTATGSQTEVGSSDNTYSIAWDSAKAGNYEIVESLGALVVAKNSSAVKLTAASESKTYDGKAIASKNVTASGLPEHFTVEATATGSQTDAGKSANVVDDGYVIKDAAGEDKTANFTNIEKVDGTLTVNPKEITVSTGADEKEYDGTALTNSKVSFNGLVEGETATIEATGSQTEVGSSENDYSITWGTAKSGNYTIVENLGTLTVTTSAAEVVLTAASDSKTYDGVALANAAVTATGLPKGFTVEATASGSQTDAGESANVVNDGYVIKDAAGDTKTANFTNVKTVDGTLTVNKAAATITTGSDSKAYDGTALTKAEAGIEGLAEGESVTLTATGSQTEVGSSDNTYSITWSGANADNYTVTENLGTLTVTENSAEVVLTAASGSKTYDGTALTNAAVTATGLPEGFTVEATATGSQTDAGDSANVVNDGYVIKNAAGVDQTASFTSVSKVDGKLTVNPKPVTITTGSDSKAYDGTALTKDEAGIEGLVNGESVTLQATGSVTEVESASNTYSIEWDKANANNYTVTENLGTLTITTNGSKVTLTAASDSKTYDGMALTNSEVTATGLPEGFTVVAETTGSKTSAGSIDNKVKSGYVIRNAAGEDKTANFTNIETVDGKLTVNPKPVTIETGSTSKAYDGSALTNASYRADGFIQGQTVTITVTGTQTEVGSSDNTYSIEWGNNASDKNYAITDKLGTLTVTKNSNAITLTAASDSKTYDGAALTNNGVTVAGIPEGFTATATASGSQTDAGESANVVNDGYVIKNGAGEDKTANFTNVNKVDGKLTVNAAPVTITTDSAEKAYDGTALKSDTADIKGLAAGESVTLAATGSQTEVGTTDNTYSIAWGTAKSGNYTIVENLGTLTVTENSAEVTLTAASDSKTYDGTALTNPKVTASGLPTSFIVEATASGSQTDADESANVVNDGYVIKNGAGEDKTANFTNVNKVDGTLKVNPKAATVTTGSGSKAYDGTALTEGTATIAGLVDGETATVTATGSQTEVGSSANTYSIEWGTAKEDNYTVTDNLGTLTVAQNTAEVMLTAGSSTAIYNGTALTNSTVTAQGLPEGFTVEATTTGSQTDVGESANVVNDGYVIRDADGVDRTANFTNVGKVRGTLTVTKAPATITTGSDSKAYDGTALTEGTATIAGLVEGETATVAATGSQTEVGSSDNTYSIAWGTAKAGNYELTETLGKLEVTTNDASVTLTAATDSKTYDGTPLANSTVAASGLPAGFTVNATASGSQTDAGESANVVNDGFRIANAAGVDKTANFVNVGKANGTLTVNPKAVTVTTGSATKEYDGLPLTKAQVGIEGLVGGESATVTATGTQTEVGGSSNTYDINWGNAKEGNYTVTENLGTLTVTANAAPVTLTAASASKTYDGTALTDATVSASGLPAGFTIDAAASGSQTTVGAAENTVNSGYVIKNNAGEDRTSSFSNVSTAAGMLTVDARSISFAGETAAKTYTGSAITLYGVTVGGSGLAGAQTHNVQATSTGTNVGTYPGSITAVDDVRIMDGQNDVTSNYNISTTPGALTIERTSEPLTVTFDSGDGYTYDGNSHSLDPSGADTNAASGETTIEYSVDGETWTTDLSTITATNAGETTIQVRATNPNYENVATTTAKLVINKRNVTLTSANDRKEYDGNALTNDEVTVGGQGWAEGEGATYSVTGTQTIVGLSSNDFTYTLNEGTSADNYTIEVFPGTLTVVNRGTAYTVEVQANSDTVTYDGGAKTVSGFVTNEVQVGGNTYTVSGLTAEGSGTNADTYAVTVSGAPVVTDASGNVVTDQFAVTATPGTLTIEPRSVTLTSADAQKEYDGDALTNDEVTVGGQGWAEGEGATYSVTGTQTLVGESENVFTYTLNEGTLEGNYSIETTNGALTVTDRAEKYAIALETNEGTFTYDADAKTVSGFKQTAFDVAGHRYEVSGLEAVANEVAAGTYEVAISGDAVVADVAGNDVTAQFDVATSAGQLVIEQAPVYISTESATKVYDGETLTAQGSIMGLAKGETVEFATTGSQTEVGTSDNTYDLAWTGTADEANYNVADEKLGTLTVTEAPAPVYTLTVNFYYEDGTPAAASVSAQHESGAAYNVPAPVIGGYTAIDANGDAISAVGGTMPDRDLVLNVVYRSIRDVVNPPAGSTEPEGEGDNGGNGDNGGDNGNGGTTGGTEGTEGTGGGTTGGEEGTGTEGTGTEGTGGNEGAGGTEGTGGNEGTGTEGAGDTAGGGAAGTTGGTGTGAGGTGTGATGTTGGATGGNAGTTGGTTPNVARATGATTPVAAINGPASAAAAIASGEAPAAEVSIDDEGNPLVESIEDDANALAGFEVPASVRGTWSLFDVLASVVTVILCAVMLFGALGRTREEEDDENEDYNAEESGESNVRKKDRNRGLRIASIAPAVVTVVALILTQDFSGIMALFDAWSVLFAIICVAQIVLLVFSRTDDEAGEDEMSDEDELGGEGQQAAPAMA